MDIRVSVGFRVPLGFRYLRVSIKYILGYDMLKYQKSYIMFFDFVHQMHPHQSVPQVAMDTASASTRSANASLVTRRGTARKVSRIYIKCYMIIY